MIPMSRREFLRISSLAAAGTIAAACVQPVTTPEAPQPAPPTAAATTAAPAPTQPPATPAPAVARFQEAPTLAALVQGGALPPVDERLPENPDVCPMLEGAGKYGGIMRRAFKGVSDYWGPSKTVGNNLTWFNFDLSVRASLAESWETSADGASWTFHLRRGTRWSDGVPFTSADFVWYWDHVLKNADLTKSPPAGWSTGSPRVLAELETPDDDTVVFRFAHPNPLFAYQVIGHVTQGFVPGHYMAQFHIDTADDKAALLAKVQAAGFQTWDQLYLDQNTWYLHPERPSVNSWIATNSMQEELFTMERNPYFWQVDSQGQQLPYIDTIHHRLYESPDVFNLWIVNGEIDFQGRNVDFGNYTLFKEKEASGDFTLNIGVSSYHTCFTPNHACLNDRLREFFGERRVRIALSHAVDRQAINDLLYYGLATPRQYSPMEVSPQYYAELSNAYLDYDVEKANALLDEAGYAQRDAEGFRLFKDGSGDTLFFTIEGIDAAGSPGEDHAQMLVKYFGEVGVKCTYKYVERSLYTEHYGANAIEAAWVIWNNRTLLPIVTPNIFIGTAIDHPWADGYGLWRTDPTNPSGVKPPDGHWIYRIWDAYDRLVMEPDGATRDEIFRELLDVWKEELPQVGYLGQFPTLIVVKNGLHNYASGYPTDDIVKDEHLLNTQALYWDEPEKHS